MLASKVVTTTSSRVEFDLIEWHEHLHFGHGLDDNFKKVSLAATHGVKPNLSPNSGNGLRREQGMGLLRSPIPPEYRQVRNTIRDTMVDGMAYSLAYREPIQKAVIDQLNYRRSILTRALCV